MIHLNLMSQLVECFVLRGIPTPLTYHVPDTIQESDLIGHHIHVPLGRSKAEAVIINQLSPETDESLKKTKPILDLNIKKPTLTNEQIDCKHIDSI